MAIDVAALEAAYSANCSYEEEGSATKARAFITVCLKLLRLPQSLDRASGTGRQAIQFDPQSLREELKNVRSWLATNGGAVTPTSAGSAAGARYFGLEGFRE